MIKDGIIQIKYPTGEMNLVIERFFPATQERVKLVFRLMRDYSPPEDQMAIYSYLSERLYELDQQVSYYGEIVATETYRSRLREASKSFRQSRMMYKRTKRNMELLQKITGLEVGDEERKSNTDGIQGVSVSIPSGSKMGGFL